MPSTNTPPFLPVPSILSLVPLLSTLAFLYLPPVIALSCNTPLTFSERRLPAILEVENNCPTARIAVCFEYDDVFYLIEHMHPASLRTFPTVYDDCWVFRSETCQGDTLLEHAVSGTRKLTVGCTKEETDANALLVAQSTTLDCSLTVTPKLTDVFNASLDTLPPTIRNTLSHHMFANRATPTQFVNKADLLAGVYQLCFRLCRHGADVNDTFNMFRHARAVVRHTENCHPELVGDQIAIAHSYLALYGYVSALSQARRLVSGAWTPSPPPLTAQQSASYQNILALALGTDLATDLPAFVLPGPTEGVGGTVAQVLVRSSANVSEPALEVHSTMRSTAGSGVDLCNSQGVGKWKFKKVTEHGTANTTMDCCASVCFLFEEVTDVHFDITSFLENCCLSCSMALCSDEIPVRTVAALRSAEVQLQKNGNKELDRPFIVITI